MPCLIGKAHSFHHCVNSTGHQAFNWIIIFRDTWMGTQIFPLAISSARRVSPNTFVLDAWKLRVLVMVDLVGPPLKTSPGHVDYQAALTLKLIKFLPWLCHVFKDLLVASLIFILCVPPSSVPQSVWFCTWRGSSATDTLWVVFVRMSTVKSSFQGFLSLLPFASSIVLIPQLCLQLFTFDEWLLFSSLLPCFTCAWISLPF